MAESLIVRTAVLDLSEMTERPPIAVEKLGFTKPLGAW